MDDKVSLNVSKLQGHENYSTWFIDVKALLRRKRLWKYIEVTAKKEEDHNEKVIDAADLITPTLSDGVKQMLAVEDFDDGAKMMAKLKAQFQPLGETQFFAYSREIFSLRHDGRDVEGLITKIKTLNERIEATKVEMTADKRALLCLSMALDSGEYGTLTQIWSLTPDMTFEKAAAMVRDVHARENMHNGVAGDTTLYAKANREMKKKCSFCGKMHGKDCWQKNPEKIPEWYKNKSSGSDDSDKKEEIVHHHTF